MIIWEEVMRWYSFFTLKSFISCWQVCEMSIHPFLNPDLSSCNFGHVMCLFYCFVIAWKCSLAEGKTVIDIRSLPVKVTVKRKRMRRRSVIRRRRDAWSIFALFVGISFPLHLHRKNHTHRRQRTVLGFTGNKMLSFLVSRETVFPSFLFLSLSLLLILHVLIFLPRHPMQRNLLGFFFDCIIISITKDRFHGNLFFRSFQVSPGFLDYHLSLLLLLLWLLPFLCISLLRHLKMTSSKKRMDKSITTGSKYHDVVWET